MRVLIKFPELKNKLYISFQNQTSDNFNRKACFKISDVIMNIKKTLLSEMKHSKDINLFTKFPHTGDTESLNVCR